MQTEKPPPLTGTVVLAQRAPEQAGAREKTTLEFFLDTCSPTGQAAQVIQFGTAHITPTLHFY